MSENTPGLQKRICTALRCLDLRRGPQRVRHRCPTPDQVPNKPCWPRPLFVRGGEIRRRIGVEFRRAGSQNCQVSKQLWAIHRPEKTKTNYILIKPKTKTKTNSIPIQRRRRRRISILIQRRRRRQRQI